MRENLLLQEQEWNRLIRTVALQYPGTPLRKFYEKIVIHLSTYTKRDKTHFHAKSERDFME
jgi:hypothetical protein